MKHARTLTEFYTHCKKDVRSLLFKYSRKFVWDAYDKEELEQGFYFMLVKRGVIENFDTSVTNIDKVFTSYMCEIIKKFCLEEKRRLKKQRAKTSRHVSEVVSEEGKKSSVFDAAQFSWMPGSRSGGMRFSTEGGHQELLEAGSESFENHVDNLCKALAHDRTMDSNDKKDIEYLIRNTSAGITAYDVAKSLGCRPSRSEPGAAPAASNSRDAVRPAGRECAPGPCRSC